jgi:hypothetical protein
VIVAPVLYLGAAPTEPAAIADLFRSEEVRTMIERPPVTRDDGFNVLTYERAQIVDGERLVVEAWRKHFELHKDGTFIGIATFADFLGWPREGDAFAGNPKVNSLALIEFTHDFFKTYEAILDHLDQLPVPIRCQVGIGGAHDFEQPLWMAPYALNTIGYEHPHARSEAPSDSVTREIEVLAQQEWPHLQPGQITYALVELVYNWFGLTSDVIPYGLADAREIDPTTF